MTDRSFSEVLEPVADHTYEVPKSFSQGRAIYGGLTAALALTEARKLADERPLRSALVSFVGPLAVGTCSVEAAVLRVGKSATQVRADVVQDGTVRCAVQALYGGARASPIVVPPRALPAAPGPETLVDVGYIEGMMPVFTQHFDMRWATGNPPFVGAPEPGFSGWIRFREPQTCALELQVAALVDAWPAPVLSMFEQPAPASSASWALEVLPLPEETDPNGFFFFESDAVAARDGWAQIRSALWTPEGQMVAHEVQTVAIFA